MTANGWFQIFLVLGVIFAITALRELALRQVAEQVDRSLESYMEAEDIRKNWAVRERMAVCISSSLSGQYLIARGARMARRMDAELYVVHVDREFGAKEPNKDTLIANLRFAESLGAQVVRLKGRSVADSVAEFVRSKHVTQVIFGPRRDSRLAQVPLSVGRSLFPSRIARGGRSHCHPGI